MTEYESNESEPNKLDELQSKMLSLQEEIEKANKEYEPLKDQEWTIHKEEETLYLEWVAKNTEIRARKVIITKEAREAEDRKKVAEYHKKNLLITIEEEKTRLSNLAKLEKQKENALLLEERWDKLTIAATWREWAKDHQIEAGHTIVKERKVILADVMGLGKTLSSIIVCDILYAATKETSPEWPFLGEEKNVYKGDGKWANEIVNSVTRPVGKKIIYLCPSSLIRNVVSEFRMWANHRSVIFIADMPKASRDFALAEMMERDDFVIVCNYETWRKDLSLVDKLIDLKPDTIILDEAHMIKNQKTSGFKGVQKLLSHARPEYVIPMTGTPVLNRPQELFTLLSLVDPDKFHTENQFLYNFCEQIPDTNYWKFQDGGLERLQKQIRKNFLRRTKDQAGIVLPEKTVIHHTLEVDKINYPNQARVRQEMAEYATIKLNETASIPAKAIIAMYTRLRQIETWPAGIKMIDKKTKEITLQVDVEESQKVDYIISKEKDEFGNYSGLIPEAIEDDRIVLFSQFKAPLYELKSRIENSGYRVCILDGDTKSKDRDTIAKDFDARYTPNRNDSKWDVVLCNYRVGGTGLNLTAATQLIVLDEEWNPGKREQAYDRIHRIGQENPVTIHVVRNEKTIDDWLAEIMARKEAMVDGFNSTMSNMDEFKDFLDNGGLM